MKQDYERKRAQAGGGPDLYAVFRHLGHVDALPQTWQAALDWLARSSWESAHKPDFERYGDAF
ncbi:GyrI-like domain-containing protein [Aeromonas sp. A-5]|uniref:GyrI-like domain-containing protein n=1 Tax=Aeromonas ichthyocola TaxID=3367746 RepID=UPI0038DCFD30